ncbi:MAG: ankyrin repeat domain-containing protein [Alphaproteobacteria bacterium]|nr:ankyrin repeat domain-containing protein [Alphaproteobacteria bacterium]
MTNDADIDRTYELLHEVDKHDCDTTLCHQLINAGIDWRIRIGGNQNTALHLCAQRGHLDIARALLDAGTPVDVTNHENSTPLIEAAIHGKANIVPLLLDHGANAAAKNKNGETALLYAPNDFIAHKLIALGADVNAKTYKNYTPLHRAASVGALDVIDVLLKKQAHINAQNIYGETPLIRAITAENLQAAKKLIAHGADVNIKTTNGDTALTIAAREKDRDVIPHLLKAGADVHATTEYIRSPLESLAARGDLENIKRLLDYGADPNQKYIENAPLPEELAAAMKHTEAAELLRHTRITRNFQAALKKGTPRSRKIMRRAPKPNL